jgi:hypothetical protein
MKSFISLFVIVILGVSFANSLPAGLPEDDVEVIGGPRRVKTTDDSADDDFGFNGVVTSDVGYPFLQPNPHSFALNFGFFDALDDILTRLRTRLYGSEDKDSSDEDASPFGVSKLFRDQNKINSSSTVKVVGGHKIEINDTFYGNENSLFKVRSINVRPLEDDEIPAEGTISSSDGVRPKAVTASPIKPKDDEEDDDDRREPIEKNNNDNEITRNIDEPEVNKIK